ncbi:hypothetical protein NQZ68_016250 [Dissostichus eleginoides]|nr:hypothetical protein NQZ68_016250 [Dissostichus eleginoides]
MRRMVANGQPVSHPRLRSQVRVTVTGILQGVLYLVCTALRWHWELVRLYSGGEQRTSGSEQLDAAENNRLNKEGETGAQTRGQGYAASLKELRENNFYLCGHMRRMVANGQPVSHPRLRSQVRVTVTGILQGVLYLICSVWAICQFFPFVFIDPTTHFTVINLYMSGTTVALGVGQAVFRRRAADIWLRAARCCREQQTEQGGHHECGPAAPPPRSSAVDE